MGKPILYGFNGSTFVRSVRMLLAEKGVAYDQVPVDVLDGETHEPEHLARNPFGKVPVFDHDGLRLYETEAIMRYVDKAFDGGSFIPDDAKSGARMTMAMSIIDSYGYAPMVAGVAAYHLFPDFVGGKDEDARAEGIKNAKLVLTEILKIKGHDTFIAGPEPTLADFYVAPPCAYIAQTPDAEKVFDIPDFDDWWGNISARESFTATSA